MSDVSLPRPEGEGKTMWTSTNLSRSSEPVFTQGGHSCGKDGWERASSLPLVLPLTQGFPVMGTSFFGSQWTGQTGKEPKASTLGKRADQWCEVLCMESVILMQIFHVLKHSLYLGMWRSRSLLCLFFKNAVLWKAFQQFAICMLVFHLGGMSDLFLALVKFLNPFHLVDVPGHKMYSAFNVFQISYSTI